ncbi:hypothetical protein C8Q74DRAFT_1218535 [Fomes fomentarius]|nr:hypothetical protein C8Q74DRAFT_1218535 [Fomes fomentarius]
MPYSAHYYNTSSSPDPWQAALQCFPDQEPAIYVQFKGYQQGFQVAPDPLAIDFGFPYTTADPPTSTSLGSQYITASQGWYPSSDTFGTNNRATNELDAQMTRLINELYDDPQPCQESYAPSDAHLTQNLPSQAEPPTYAPPHLPIFSQPFVGSSTSTVSRSEASPELYPHMPAPSTFASGSDFAPSNASMPSFFKFVSDASTAVPASYFSPQCDDTRSPPLDQPVFRDKDMKCRYCSHVQENRRRKDLERHEQTHFPMPNLFVCVGVPEDSVEGRAWSARAEGLVNVHELEYVVRDLRRCGLVGGCGKQFSRLDSYQTHMKRKGCIGDHHASYHLGTKLKRRW